MRIPNAFLRETIVVEDYSGPGVKGPKYSAGRTVRALLQPTSRLVTDPQGRVVTADALLVVRPETGPVATESRVTWSGQVFRVVSAFAMPDTRRPYFWQLALQRLEH